MHTRGLSLTSVVLALSISVASAAVPAEAGPSKTFEIFVLESNSPPITIDLPSDFVLTEREGPDFTVYYFSLPPEKLGGSNEFVTIYAGWAPGLFTKTGPPKPPGTVTSQRHTTAGQDVEWFCWEDKSKGRVLERETQLENLFRGMKSSQGTDWGGLKLHVIIGASDPATLDRLQASVDKMKVPRR